MIRRISTLLAVLLIFSLTVPALAADINLDSPGTGGSGYTVNNQDITVGDADNTLSGGDGSYSLHFANPNASVVLNGDVKTSQIFADHNLTINGPGSLEADDGIYVGEALTVDGGADVSGTVATGRGVSAGDIVVKNGSLTGKSNDNNASDRGIWLHEQDGAIQVGDTTYTQEAFDRAFPNNRPSQGGTAPLPSPIPHRANPAS